MIWRAPPDLVYSRLARSSIVKQSSATSLARSKLCQRRLAVGAHQNSRLTTDTEEEIERFNAEISETSATLDELHNDQQEKARAIVRVQKNSERYMGKRQTLLTRREDCENAIRDLGVLPEEAFSKYTGGRADKVCM